MTDTVQRAAWLVIPLYNEGPVIGTVVEEARRTFPHIVCVDDGSSDDSADRAEAAGAVVVRHPINLGQGAALQTGIDYVVHQTAGEFLVTFDADGQHRVEDAAAMVGKARQEDLAAVFGSRFLDGRTDTGWLKRQVLRVAVTMTNWSSGMKLTDAHNGLRVIRRDLAERLDLTQNRMAHASEIVEQIGDSGLPWAEYPVHVLYTDYSRSKGQSVFNSVNILTELLFK